MYNIFMKTRRNHKPVISMNLTKSHAAFSCFILFVMAVLFPCQRNFSSAVSTVSKSLKLISFDYSGIILKILQQFFCRWMNYALNFIPTTNVLPFPSLLWPLAFMFLHVSFVLRAIGIMLPSFRLRRLRKNRPAYDFI